MGVIGSVAPSLDSPTFICDFERIPSVSFSRQFLSKPKCAEVIYQFLRCLRKRMPSWAISVDSISQFLLPASCFVYYFILRFFLVASTPQPMCSPLAFGFISVLIKAMGRISERNGLGQPGYPKWSIPVILDCNILQVTHLISASVIMFAMLSAWSDDLHMMYIAIEFVSGDNILVYGEGHSF